jgi:hypothetical protein
MKAILLSVCLFLVAFSERKIYRESLAREVIENKDLRGVYNAYAGVFVGFHQKE